MCITNRIINLPRLNKTKRLKKMDRLKPHKSPAASSLRGPSSETPAASPAASGAPGAYSSSSPRKSGKPLEKQKYLWTMVLCGFFAGISPFLGVLFFLIIQSKVLLRWRSESRAERLPCAGLEVMKKPASPGFSWCFKGLFNGFFSGF